MCLNTGKKQRSRRRKLAEWYMTSYRKLKSLMMICCRSHTHDGCQQEQHLMVHYQNTSSRWTGRITVCHSHIYTHTQITHACTHTDHTIGRNHGNLAADLLTKLSRGQFCFMANFFLKVNPYIYTTHPKMYTKKKVPKNWPLTCWAWISELKKMVASNISPEHGSGLLVF